MTRRRTQRSGPVGVAGTPFLVPPSSGWRPGSANSRPERCCANAQMARDMNFAVPGTTRRRSSTTAGLSQCWLTLLHCAVQSRSSGPIQGLLHKARRGIWTTPTRSVQLLAGLQIERTPGHLVQRLKPRENPEVNGHWMCDYGRANYEWMNQEGRIEAPAVGRGEKRRAADWQHALHALFARLSEAEGASVRVVASPFSSNEALAALLGLAETAGDGDGGVFRSRRAEDEDPLPGFPALVRRRIWLPMGRGGHSRFHSRWRRCRCRRPRGAADHEASPRGSGRRTLRPGRELRRQHRTFFIYCTFDSPAARNADFRASDHDVSPRRKEPS